MITKKMEQAYRLCHHDFEGLSTQDAAEQMGVSQRAVQRLLCRLEGVAPQLFPILTKIQARTWHLFVQEAMSYGQIAELEDISPGSVARRLKNVRRKLGLDKKFGLKRLQFVDPKRLDASTERGW